MSGTITGLLLLLVSYCGFAQTGTIRGSVRDDITDRPLIGATVVVDFSGQKSNTNAYGDFLIGGVPVGNVSITIYNQKYKTRRIDGLRVVAGRTTVVNTHLKEELLKVNDSVNAKRFQDTEVAVITEIKNSENFATGISAEELVRTQDVDAAQSLKRVAGVLISDERFVVIRGLNERYNQVLINDVPAPSSEIDSRAFSFDVVPTPLIDRLMVYKSGSADLPGDFAGGIVKIYTKDIPDSNRWYFGLASSFRQQTTLRTAERYQGGATDFLGYDDGTRSFVNLLPERLPDLVFVPGKIDRTTARERSTRVNGVWNTDEWRALPDFRFNLGYTGKFHVGKSLIGHLTMLDYQNTNQILETTRNRFTGNSSTPRIDTVFRQTDQSYASEIRVGGIQNWTFAINNRNKVELKNLLNIITTDNTTLRREYDFGGAKKPLREWNAYQLQYERRLVYSGQLAGTHYVSSNTQFKWTAGYGLTNRNEPNTRRFRHYRPPYTYSPQRSDYLGLLARTDSMPNYRNASHFYSDLNERVISASAHLDQVLNPLAEDNKQIKLSVGGFVERKSRDFSARLFAYEPTTYRNRNGSRLYQRQIDTLSWPEPFFGAQINDTVGLVVNEKTQPTDKYEASNMLFAGFASIFYPITTSLSIRAGLRYEVNNQSVTTGGKTIDVPLTSPLPSFHLTYDFNDQALLRLAYNGSVIRPALGELAPFTGYDFQFDAYRTGNTDLKTTSVQNFDARIELYPTRYDIITFGGFYKTFDKPIELVMDSTQYVTQMQFINSKSAYQWGVELELRRSFKDIFKDPFLRCLSISGNLTFTGSQVTVTDQQEVLGLDNKRPLLGQSPYSANFGLYYINAKQRAQVNLMYNVFGPRVWAVGNSIHPTVYEMSRHVLNLNITKEIGKYYEARMSIQDLLNMPYRLVQDDSRNGNPDYSKSIISNYRRGTLVTVGILMRL